MTTPSQTAVEAAKNLVNYIAHTSSAQLTDDRISELDGPFQRIIQSAIDATVAEATRELMAERDAYEAGCQSAKRGENHWHNQWLLNQTEKINLRSELAKMTAELGMAKDERYQLELQWQQLAKELSAAKTERDALRAQIHDLCHDKHVSGPVTAEEFCNGCEQFQMSIFGTSPITTLRAERDALREKLDKIDAFLYGPTKLSYEPNRVLTLKAIRELGTKHRETLQLQIDALREATQSIQATTDMQLGQIQYLREAARVKDEELTKAFEWKLQQSAATRVKDEALETAIRWLRRIAKEYPGCLNDYAIDKHLSPALSQPVATDPVATALEITGAKSYQMPPVATEGREEKWEYAYANSDGQWSNWITHDPSSSVKIGDTNGGYRKWQKVSSPQPPHPDTVRLEEELATEHHEVDRLTQKCSDLWNQLEEHKNKSRKLAKSLWRHIKEGCNCNNCKMDRALVAAALSTK